MKAASGAIAMGNNLVCHTVFFSGKIYTIPKFLLVLASKGRRWISGENLVDKTLKYFEWVIVRCGG